MFLLRTFILTAVSFLILHCSGTQSLQTQIGQGSSDSIVDSSQSGQNQEEEEGFGTVVSLPRPSQLTNSVIFKIYDQSEEEIQNASEVDLEEEGDWAQDLDLANASSIEKEFPYCRRLKVIPETRMCALTPQTYDLGIQKIILLSCVDENQRPASCDFEHPNLAGHAVLYAGEQVDLVVTKKGIQFPKELKVLQNDITVSALQIVIGYVGQKLPTAELMPKESQKVASDLEGSSYRRCTTNHRRFLPEEMRQFCGNQEARFSDYLIDLNKDGQYGFLNLTKKEPVKVIESEHRPRLYDNKILQKFFKEGIGLRHFTGDGLYRANGHMGVLFNLENPVQIETTKAYHFYIHIDKRKSLRFIDGARSFTKRNEKVCVDFWSENACAIDSDPESPAVYDPLYDIFALTFKPKVKVVVEEKEEKL